MSKKLLESIERFLKYETSVDAFVENYIRDWRKERDSGELLLDDSVTSTKLSSAFCIADMYSPEQDRLDYEFDEQGTRFELEKLLQSEGND